MTHLSNRREAHTFIILSKGVELERLTCSRNYAMGLVRKYRRSLKCEVRAISC
jgi:hypothetical protein